MKGSRQSRSSSQLTCRNKSAAVSTEPEISNNGHGSSTQKRFSGDGNSVAAEYKMQKRYARAAFSCPESWWNAPKRSDVLDMYSSAWSGRIGTGIEAMEEAFGLKFMKNETTDT